MKTVKVLATALVMLSLVFSSCSKSDTTDNTPQPKETFISYKYNGVVYRSVPSTVTSLKRAIVAQYGTAPVKLLTISTPIIVGVGSFDIVDKASNVDVYGASFTDYATNASIIGKSGTVKITLSDTQYIEGTFEFSETVNNVTNAITEGSFRALK
jgi:hypothetical protein